MKHAYFFIALALFSSCNPNSKKNESEESVISSDSLTDKEAEYLKTRDAYIEQIGPFMQARIDTLNQMDDRALLNLETRLKEILKDAKYSVQGKNNLETLTPMLGFGKLDGLTLEKDSMKIFYTSKNLFLNYFKEKKVEVSIPESLDGIFQSAFASNWFILDFTHIKIPSPKGTVAYGMVGLGGQGIGPFPPDHLHALLSTDKYIYLIEKWFKNPINELPECKSEWETIHAEAEKLGERYRASNLEDTAAINKSFKLDEEAFNKYRECYQRGLPSDPQFEALKKQLESMVKYLEP